MPANVTQTVVDYLQTSVSLHLTAIENYASQSFFYARWGYSKLAERYKEDAKEERGHLSQVAARLEFYDIPMQFSHDAPAWPRHDFEAALQANYELEMKAAGVERAAILACRESGDELTALVFADLLHGSEASIADIEGIKRVIDEIGLDNYLANQV